MLPVLLVLFVAVPIIELAAILQVGDWIGFWPTIALLVLDSILGAMLMRSQGRAAWRRFNAALAEGRPPAREVIDGVLVIFGGALLLTPGFVTDIVGITFLLPPTRALIRSVLVKRFAARMIASATAGAGRRFGASFGPRPAGPHAAGPRDFDVDGTATEVRDHRRLP